ncbi:MAG: transposase, partial [Chromatiaceae bacterium]|nr:transposase [Chromatiaceae bacterium]
LERLAQVPASHGEQQVVYRRPKPQRDGRTALSLTPLEFIDHLAALIPPRRLHRHRYHGVLAPNAPLRLAATAYWREADLSTTTTRGFTTRRHGAKWPLPGALPVGHAHRPSVPHAAAGLPVLRCRPAHRRLHYRGRPGAADSQPQRRAGRAATH